MDPTAIPSIYAPRFPDSGLSWAARVVSLGFSLGCAAVLIIAAKLTPDAHGVGTHTELGMKGCGFLTLTGIPCIACGMTTSFAHFAHGNLLASFYVQPMGAVLAVISAVGFWVGLYLAITGKPALRLVRLIPPSYYVLPLMFFAIAAWGWKIYIHTHGMDGW